MGEMAEYYIERDLDMMMFDNIPNHTEQDLYWYTSKGEKLLIANMDSDHILNCIHLNERRHVGEGIRFLNNAPTYRHMVDTLIIRKVLSVNYYKLTLEQRKKIKM